MSIYRKLSSYASAWREARELAETRRVLSALPNEILKDIGWPQDNGRGRHQLDGSWFGGR
ncbi:MAG: DUF1127 domain-containing protein [Rhizobiaceae bacterium]|nr:DUF1127 domain-containing protein [Rhizobiaceae bacterium]